MASRELEIIIGMQSWWHDLSDYSPEQERAYNAAVLRCAEAIRRYDNYDETRALFIHRLLFEKVVKGKG